MNIEYETRQICSKHLLIDFQVISKQISAL